jgi:RNA polymerase sigma-70 factor (ECF subfamily)
MDAADLESLYRIHGPGLLRYLARQFRHAAAPEDLLHETFVQALRQPEGLAAAVSHRAWLFGIARKLGLAAVRGRRRQVLAPLPDVAAPAAEVDERVVAMRQAIAALPTHLRQTMELRLGEELTYEEIATVLAIPVGTVRSRLHAALRELRQRLIAPSDIECPKREGVR